jgi:hypothetical protein
MIIEERGDDQLSHAGVKGMRWGVRKADSGFTPLHQAAQDYDVASMKTHLAAGMNPNAKDVHGNTPLHTAVFNSKGKGAMIKLLVANGANPDQKNNSGVSPKDLANKISNYPVAQHLKTAPSLTMVTKPAISTKSQVARGLMAAGGTATVYLLAGPTAALVNSIAVNSANPQGRRNLSTGAAMAKLSLDKHGVVKLSEISRFKANVTKASQGRSRIVERR